MVLLCGSVAMAGGPKPPPTANLDVVNHSSNPAVVIVDVTAQQQAQLFAPGITLAQQQALIAQYQVTLGNTQTVNGNSKVTFPKVLVGNHTVSVVYPDGVNPVAPGNITSAIYNVQQLAKSKTTTANVSQNAGGAAVLAFRGAAREFAVASFGVGGLLLLGLIGCRLGRKAQA
jgi:hypothetical protein